jgi:hypothetical protein
MAFYLGFGIPAMNFGYRFADRFRKGLRFRNRLGPILLILKHRPPPEFFDCSYEPICLYSGIVKPVRRPHSYDCPSQLAQNFLAKSIAIANTLA